MFALGVKVAAAGVGLGAMVAMWWANGFVEFSFGFFHRVLALCPVVCMKDGSGHEEHERDHDDSSDCLFTKSKFNGILLFNL